MTVQLDGELLKRSTGLGGRITSVSSQNKEAFVSFVNETLTRLDPSETFQLTIVMKPGRYEACYVTAVTTDSSATTLKTE